MKEADARATVREDLELDSLGRAASSFLSAGSLVPVPGLRVGYEPARERR